MEQTPNPFACDCNGHTFNASGPYGRAMCPQCRAMHAVTRKGVRPLQTIKVGRPHTGRSADTDRLFSVMRATDGSILCTGCAARTDLLTGQEGSLAGKSGIYCVLCLATRPVRVLNDTERITRGFLRIQPVTWNTTIQRIDAENGILTIARAIAAGFDPLGYGVLLDGANWTGLRVRPLPSRLLQTGQRNPYYMNALRTPERIDVQGLGSYLVGCPDPWFATATIHPDQCTCETCKRRASGAPIRLRPLSSEQVTVLNGVTLRTIPRRALDGIGKQAIACVAALLDRPNHTPLRAHVIDTRTLPTPSRPRPDPVMPLPRMTAYQSLVWRQRRIIPIQTT